MCMYVLAFMLCILNVAIHAIIYFWKVTVMKLYFQYMQYDVCNGLLRSLKLIKRDDKLITKKNLDPVIDIFLIPK